jgi:hypothetical protein
MKHLNSSLYTDLPISELDDRLAMEELEEKLELSCWGVYMCPVNCPNQAPPAEE